MTKREYEAVIAYTLSLGMENVFIQEGETAKESVIPKFDEKGILERHSLTEPGNFTSVIDNSVGEWYFVIKINRLTQRRNFFYRFSKSIN